MVAANHVMERIGMIPRCAWSRDSGKLRAVLFRVVVVQACCVAGVIVFDRKSLKLDAL